MNPTMKTLRMDHLTVDRDVQRVLDEAWVSRKLRSDGFQREALGVLVVSLRSDGTYHVMDGQHRRALAMQAGYPDLEVECQVHEGLTPAQEAAMFRHLNERRAVQPLYKFLVRVVEGDPVAVGCHELLVKHGWNVSHSKNDGQFSAVAALQKIYTGANIRVGPCPEVVDQTLSIIVAAWGHSSNGARNEVISGLGMLLLQHLGEADIPKITSELASLEAGPLTLVGRARGLRGLRGGRVSDAVADIIVMLHNSKKRTNRLPDWRTT